MLTDEQTYELAELRTRAYGPGGGLDAAAVARLATLERMSRDEMSAGFEPDQSSPGSVDAESQRHRRPWRTAAAVAAAAGVIAVVFAVGYFVGGQRGGVVTDPNAGLPAIAQQSLQRVSDLERWEDDSLRFVGSVRDVAVWIGTVRGGSSACAAFDRGLTSTGSARGVWTACQPIDPTTEYPLRLQWTRTFDGLSETYAVILGESGATQLSYSTS